MITFWPSKSFYPAKWLPFFWAGTLLLSCNYQKDTRTDESILARIGDRTISVNEFIRRAEYTPRPAYCAGDNYIHRKIVLNSLIAEKLLALEAEDNDELRQNQEFQAYLVGRKEQAMRQWFYYKEAFEKVEIDSNDVKPIYQLSGRTYRLAYLTIDNAEQAAEVQGALAAGGADRFQQVAQQLSGQLQTPQREVAFQAVENETMLDSLFTVTRSKNQIVGPVKSEDGNFTFVQILGWTDRKLLSPTDIQRRWQDAQDWLTEKTASQSYDRIVAQLMKGKTIEFMPETFRKLVNLVGPMYLRSREQKEQAFSDQFWKKNEEIQLEKQADQMAGEPLFRIDGQIWSVADFEQEMQRHPLVFRKRNMAKSEFAEQFKLAIVDMVRDRYVTTAAYEAGYDKAEEVQRNAQMWRDNLSALYQQNKYLHSLGLVSAFRNEPVKIIESRLNPLIDSLQAKYSEKIAIDTERFESIKLSRIDLFAVQRNMPFPVVVPSFPMITTDHTLDYGKSVKNPHE